MNSNGKHSGLSSLLIATDGSVYADVAAEKVRDGDLNRISLRHSAYLGGLCVEIGA